MTVSVHLMCFSTAIIASLVGVLLFFFTNVNASLECTFYDFPCEDGGCVNDGLWCDSYPDCGDGSDEKYCKKTSLFNKNPNNCPLNYFRCSDGPCIPMVGVCDDYPHCGDESDERNCQLSDSLDSNSTEMSNSLETNISTTTISAATVASTEAVTATTHRIPVINSVATNLPDSFETYQQSVLVANADFQPSDYNEQLQEAREWLFSQRKSDFGWGTETPRAITAWYLSEVPHSSRKNEIDILMVKQLELCLSLDIARNSSKAMQLTDLALYINALVAICKDPNNFYGENLVRILRNGVDGAHRLRKFVNPSVYLTLCINNATTFDDMMKLVDIFSSKKNTLQRIDVQALAMSTVTCILKKTNYIPVNLHDDFKRQFFQRVNAGGIPGNVYNAALIFQALQELKTLQPGLLEFILRQQHNDGSFGDIFATYLVLSALAGRSFLEMNAHCDQRYTTDPAPIEVLKNAKRPKIYCTYSLNYGYPPEVTQIIQMKVAEGINFLDIMRLAQEINPKFRFKLDVNGDVPVVYSIGGIPNDAEKGTFWTLYMTSSGAANNTGRLSPFSGNIKNLVPQTGDEFVFWYKSI